MGASLLLLLTMPLTASLSATSPSDDRHESVIMQDVICPSDVTVTFADIGGMEAELTSIQVAAINTSHVTRYSLLVTRILSPQLLTANRPTHSHLHSTSSTALPRKTSASR